MSLSRLPRFWPRRHATRAALACSALLAGCASGDAGRSLSMGAGSSHVSTCAIDVPAVLRDDPFPSGVPAATREIGRTQHASVHLVHIRDAVRPHVHREHDEVVYVVSGTGTLVLDGEERPLTPGIVMSLPAGLAHGIRASGEGPIQLVAIHVPPFDGADRQLIELAPVRLAAASSSASEPFHRDALEAVRSGPIPPSLPAASVELHRGPRESIHIVQVRESVRAHFHREHEEIVIALTGSGTFEIDGRTHEVAAGWLIAIPPGRVHGYRNASDRRMVISSSSEIAPGQVQGPGDGPTAVLSIFVPPFDGADRHFVESP